MPAMRVVHYRDRRGRQPVDDFVEGLPPKHQAAIDLAVDRLNGLTPHEVPGP